MSSQPEAAVNTTPCVGYVELSAPRVSQLLSYKLDHDLADNRLLSCKLFCSKLTFSTTTCIYDRQVASSLLSLDKVNKVRNRLVVPRCVDPAHFRPLLDLKSKILHFRNHKSQIWIQKKSDVFRLTVKLP